jgi:integrase
LQFLQNLRKDDDTPLGENTMKHIHSTASGIFSYATANGFCEHNPWRDVPVGHAPAIAAEQGAAYDQKTVEMMIANLEAERAAEPDGRKDWSLQLAQGVLAVGIFAGLRPSEIAGLQWQAVDFENRTITVRQAYVYGKEKATTKTGKERVVPFRDELTGILRAWWGVCGSPKSGWVFPNRDGNPVNLNDLSARIIGPNCAKNGLDWKDDAYYALRRGCGSLLVQDGWNCEEVAQFLGNTRDVVWKYYFVDRQCALAGNARERSRRKALMLSAPASRMLANGVSA